MNKPKSHIFSFRELRPTTRVAVVVNGISERNMLGYEAPNDVVFSFHELKSTTHIRDDHERAFGTLYVVLPNSAEISTCM